MATGLLLDPIYQKHDTGEGHPESIHRAKAISAALQDDGLAEQATSLAVRPATDEEVILVHTEPYLQLVKSEIGSGSDRLSTGDTIVDSDSLEVARAATGGVLNAVDQLFAKTISNAFCVVRPPGHHATADRGMGFCIFNNVAVAARYAQQKHQIERVAIIDWDVHHGNGTQDIFYQDPSVFYFSTHQYPWYPGTGAKDETGSGKGEGSILNAPLPAGSGMIEIKEAFADQFLKEMEEFKPELVIISAGFDSRIDDPLGHFTLSDDDFSELTKLLMGLAERHADHRVLSVLEGGYNLTGLASATKSHFNTLLAG